MERFASGGDRAAPAELAGKAAGAGHSAAGARAGGSRGGKIVLERRETFTRRSRRRGIRAGGRPELAIRERQGAGRIGREADAPANGGAGRKSDGFDCPGGARGAL